MELEPFDKFPVDKIAEYAQRKRDRRSKAIAWAVSLLVAGAFLAVCYLALASPSFARVLGYCLVGFMALVLFAGLVAVVFAAIYYGPKR